MSDLTATACGCNTSVNSNNGCNSIIWIIILLSLCGGCGNGTSLFGNNGSDCGCESIIWILLLLSFCGNGNSLGCGCGC